MDDFKLYVATEETVNHFNILFSNNIQKDMGTELWIKKSAVFTLKREQLLM